MSRMDADLFRGFRKEKGMTQNDLARVLDVHFRTIQNIESGKFRPSRRTEEKFAELTTRHAKENADAK